MLVTERAKPLRHGNTVIHQIGVPWHWGADGLSTGDAANELLSRRARPERAHHGDQGRHLRHPGGQAAATGRTLVGFLSRTIAVRAGLEGD